MHNLFFYLCSIFLKVNKERFGFKFFYCCKLNFDCHRKFYKRFSFLFHNFYEKIQVGPLKD